MSSVSILVPCYNSEEHLAETIESALGQTWPACEIIVVDDGSTDGSLEVARAYEGEDVRIIEQSNQGAPAARNRAFQASTGDYIQYLDADDLLHPRKIEAQVAALRESDPGTVAVCSTVYFQDGESPEEGQRAKGEQEVPWLTSNDPVQWLINLWTPGTGWGMVQTGAWLTPREVIKRAGAWAEYVNPDDDGEFFTRVLLQSTGVEYVKDGCVYYRQHSGERVSGLVSKNAFQGLLRSIDTRRDYLLPKTTEENREDAVFVIARSYWKIAVRALPVYSDLAEAAASRARALGMDEPPLSALSSTPKSRAMRSVLGWRMTRYLQYYYRRLTSEAI